LATFVGQKRRRLKRVCVDLTSIWFCFEHSKRKLYQVLDYKCVKKSVLGLSPETYQKMIDKYGKDDKSWQTSSDYAIVQIYFMKK
jgi:hypothetical protein